METSNELDCQLSSLKVRLAIASTLGLLVASTQMRQTR